MKAVKSVICIIVALVVAFCAVFVLYHTSWGTDAYKTFYLTDTSNNIYSTVDYVTLPIRTAKTFKVKYSLSKQTGYTAKVYSYVTEENVFKYTVADEEKQFSPKMDFTEQFEIEPGKSSFTLTMPESMLYILQEYNGGAEVQLEKEADITSMPYFRLVVTSADEEHELTILLKGKESDGVAHEHSYSVKWSYDNEKHWHASTCGHAVKADFDPHTNENGVCPICGYSYKSVNDGDNKHEHTYSTEWSSDETTHYHIATCGHDAIRDIAYHTFENGACSICGRACNDSPEHVHSFNKAKWTYDKYSHWYASTCGHDVKSDTAAHTFERNVCTVCGYDENADPDHIHTYDYYTWVYDEVEHWHASTCGHDERTAITSHTFENGICTTCGYEQHSDVAHVHVYSDKWTKDEFDHWHATICGHNLIKDLNAHSFNADGMCKVCGYMRVGEAYKYNYNELWHYPPYTTLFELHTFENGVCTVCGYKQKIVFE